MKLKAVVALSLWITTACTDQAFTIDVPLRVVNVQPSAAARHVGRDALVVDCSTAAACGIHVDFSEELLESSLDGNFTLRAIGGEMGTAAAPVDVAITTAYIGGDSNRVTLVPTALLAYSTDYRLTITSKVLRKRDKGPLPITVTSDFSTEDPAPLGITSIDPGDGGVGIARTSTLTVTFSEPPNCAGMNDGTTVVEAFDVHPRFATLTDGPVVGTWSCPTPAFLPEDATAAVSCDGGACLVTFEPADSAFMFEFSSHVTITLMGGSRADGAIESTRATERGGQLSETVVATFRTVDPPVLHVVGAQPSGGAVGVATDSDLTITFSEPIDCTTIDNSNFIVIETPDGGAALAQNTCTFTCPALAADGVTALENAVTCNPQNDFGLTSSISVSLSPDPTPRDAGGAIESLRASSLGGQLNSLVYTFETEDPPAIAVVAHSPGGGSDLVPENSPITITFSEAVDCNTLPPLNGSTFVVESCSPSTGGAACAGGSDAAFTGNTVTGTASCAASIFTFTPTISYAFDDRVRVTLTSSIASQRATSGGGQLLVDTATGLFQFIFDVVPVPPLLVVTTTPSDGSANVSQRSEIEIEFSLDVLMSTLCTEPTAVLGPCQTEPNIWLAVKGDSDPVANRVPLVLVEYGVSTAKTAIFKSNSGGAPYNGANDTDLTPGTVYQLFVRDGSNGVRTSTSIIAGGILVYEFSVGGSAFIDTFEPRPDGAMDVDVSAPICVTFTEDTDPTSITNSTFFAEFVDRFGRLVSVMEDGTYVDPDTATASPGYDFTDANGFNDNRVCLIPGAVIYGCATDPQRTLLYDTTYTVTLLSSITLVPSGSLVGGYGWTFTTGAAPYVTNAFAENFLVSIDPLAGTEEVPVNSDMVVEFSEPIAAGSVVPGTTVLLRDSGAADVPFTFTLSSGGQQLTIQPSIDLVYADEHVLTLVSDQVDPSAGIVTLDGEWLDANATIAFTTSPATTVAFSPPAGENAVQTAVAFATFSRPMYLPSINSHTFFADDAGTAASPTIPPDRMTATVALNAADVDSAIFSPVPTWVDGHDITLYVTTGAMDYLGNPLPENAAVGAGLAGDVNYPSIQKAPALNARAPTAINLSTSSGSLVPGDGDTVSGDQLFTLTHPSPGAKLNNRMVPPTFSEASIWIDDVDSCSGGGMLPHENTFIIGASGSPDIVTFRSTLLLRAGCAYDITLVQGLYSNVHTASVAGPQTITVTGEAVRPRLSSLSPAAGAIAAGSSFVINFDEFMDAASVDSSTVQLIDLDGPTVVPATLALTAADEVTLTPDAPLSLNTSGYELVVPTATDMAGNLFDGTGGAFNGGAVVYTVEVVPPQAAVTAPASAGDAIIIDFDEPIDVATIVADTETTDGTIRVRQTGANGTKFFGCVTVNAAGTRVTIEPAVSGGFDVPGNYDIIIVGDGALSPPGIADQGGTSLSGDVVVAFTQN